MLLDAVTHAKLAGEASAVMAGWREIGRIRGFHAPERRQVEVTSAAAQTERARFEAMSDEQLIAMITEQG